MSSVLPIFSKLYGERWQHRQEHILRNVLLTLLERPETHTLLDVCRLLSDWRYRKLVVAGVKDPMARAFWQDEFSRCVYQFKGEALAPIQNKLGAFLTAPLARNIVGNKESRLDFREALDSGKILLVNLAKGRIGEDSAVFLGSLIITRLYLAALERIDIPEAARWDFHLYVDEFPSFVAAETFASILSEALKYRLCLILAHQHLGQLDEPLRKAIFGNVGTVIAFPMGPEDAERLGAEFSSEFRPQDLVDHIKHHMCLKLAINGRTSRPFRPRPCRLSLGYNLRSYGRGLLRRPGNGTLRHQRRSKTGLK